MQSRQPKRSKAATPPRAEPPPRATILACRAAAALVIAGALVVNASATWNRWGDLITDTGRELDTPKQLAEGKVLYRDVRYYYGPLIPSFHALLYQAFGVRVDVLATAGLSLAGLLAWLSYRLLRLFVHRAAASVGAVMVVSMNAFGAYMIPNVFNFVLPYSYPAVYGTLLGLASVNCLLRNLRNGRRSDFLLACGLLGLIALCKVETLAAALAAHAVFVVLSIRQKRMGYRTYAIGYVAAAAVPIGVYSYYRIRVGPSLWSDNLFLPGNVSVSDFILRHSGLLEPARSLRTFATSLIGLSGCLLVGWLAAGLERRLTRSAAPGSGVSQAEPHRPLRIAISIVCAAAVAVVVLGGFEISDVFNGLPAVIVAAGVAILVSRGRKHEPSARADGVIVLFVFSLAALLRLGLCCRAAHYGFYLSIPALLSLTVVVCGVWPRVLDRARPRRLYAPMSAGLALLVSLIVLHARERNETLGFYYPRPELQTIRGPRGAMGCMAPFIGSVDDAVAFLQRQPPGTKVVVFPEGAAMTFLAGCENAIGMHMFLPADFAGAYDESGVIARLAANPPDFVLVDSRDITEYGKRKFGGDYAKSVADWLRTHYQPVKVFQTDYFAVQVFERRWTESAPHG